MIHPFNIVIGSESAGHGKSVAFRFKANKPIAEVREAYYAARKLHPRLSPEKIAESSASQPLDDAKRALFRGAGCPVIPSDETLDDGDGFTAADLAALTAWFIEQGDEDLIVEAWPVDEIPSLSPQGIDHQGRFISAIGYGLFG